MTNLRSTAAAAALAAAGILSLVGQQPASVSAFAPSAYAGRQTLTRSSSPSTVARSTVLEAAETDEVAAATIAPAASVADKPKKKKKKSAKSTKTGPKASAAAAPKNGKSGKSGKRPKRGKSGKRGKRSKRSALSSEKSALRDLESKKDLLPLSSLRLGQTITGYVAGISSFGAFVKTDYKLEGGGGRGSGYALLHISQISSERVDNVGDVLEIGQKLEGLRVTDVNYARGEVGVSLRPRRPNRFPLSVVRKGEEMEGKVKSVVPYGAFVDVGCKVNALLHVSRMSTEEVRNVDDVVREGDFIKVRIIDVDKEKRTLACSILDKKADEYLDRRRKQAERRADKAAKDANEGGEGNSNLQTELAYFEEALKELENAFK